MVIKPYTTKQMGDACEMLVAAEMTLAGVPALKVPDNWPGYDVIAEPAEGKAQRVSVKSRTFKRGGSTYVVYKSTDRFDWLAIFFLPGDGLLTRRVFVIPRKLADAKARKDKPTSKTAGERYWPQDQIEKVFSAFENNFTLNANGRAKPTSPVAPLIEPSSKAKL